MFEFYERDLCYELVGIGFKVHKSLGCGFLEKCYENAFCVELLKRKIPFEKQKRYELFYEGTSIGVFYADLVVAGKVILELKAVETFSKAMEAQLIHYLRVSGIQIGYLMNFGDSGFKFRRLVV